MGRVSVRAAVLARCLAIPLAVCAGLSTVAPAEAQFFVWGGRPTVPAPAIFQQLSAAGYRLLSPIIRQGDVYMVDAADVRGYRRRLVIDAYTGALLSPVPRRREAYLPSPPAYPPYPSAPAYPAAPPVPRVDQVPRIETVPRPRTATRSPAVERPRASPIIPRSAPVAAVPAVVPNPAPAAEPAAVRPATAVPAVTPAAAPSPVAAAPRRPIAPANGPGYANGVPINPLD